MLLCSGVCQLFPVSQARKWIKRAAIKEVPEATEVTAEALQYGDTERLVSFCQSDGLFYVCHLSRSHLSTSEKHLIPHLQMQGQPTPKQRAKSKQKKPQVKVQRVQRKLKFRWCDD